MSHPQGKNLHVKDREPVPDVDKQCSNGERERKRFDRNMFDRKHNVKSIQGQEQKDRKASFS